MNLRALVCDDESLVRAELGFVLREVVPSCEIVEVESATAALCALHDHHFDVLFLDIHMPGLTGIEALRTIESIPQSPPVIIVSAHEDYALAAFEHAAVDYLLKPVSTTRIRKALERAQRSRASAMLADGRIPIEINGATRLVASADIRFVEASGHRILIHLYDEVGRFRGSLTECERQLEGHGFVRVHRAYLVNPTRVVEVSSPIAGIASLRLDTKTPSCVPISRAHIRAVRARFQR